MFEISAALHTALHGAGIVPDRHRARLFAARPIRNDPNLGARAALTGRPVRLLCKQVMRQFQGLDQHVHLVSGVVHAKRGAAGRVKT